MNSRAAIERWSALESPLHSADARAKLAGLLVLLIAIAITPSDRVADHALHALIVLAAMYAARLPMGGLLGRAAVVLPLSGAAAIWPALAGDLARAGGLLVRSYLSTAAVLVVVGSTPMPQLFSALESLRVPRAFTLVLQFLYRFLFVVADQALRMRQAAVARQGVGSVRSLRFAAASGTVATLFASSHARAGRIHNAMIARGFSGRLPMLGSSGGRGGEWVALAGLTVVLAVMWWRA